VSAEEHPKNVATVEADNSNVVWYTTSIWAEKLVKTIRPTKVNVENRDLLDLCRANPCSAPSRLSHGKFHANYLYSQIFFTIYQDLFGPQQLAYFYAIAIPSNLCQAVMSARSPTTYRPLLDVVGETQDFRPVRLVPLRPPQTVLVGCVAQLVEPWTKIHERRSLTGELSLSYARPAADG